MSYTSNESDSRMRTKDQIELPSVDEEGSCEGSISGGSGGLKKGPWTSAEDAILVDYVKKHGEGNWNAVQKNSGLSRCGKSCRLRWANHLRPNLKKGTFTSDEEQRIIELHAKMGNKWARMAAQLPGRTDNEIKNYWNTRIKRRQRAGLPIYPPNLCFHPSNENQQSQGGSEFSDGNKQNDEFLQPSSYDIPDLDDFKPNQGTLSFMPPFADISVNRMLNQGLESQNYGFITSTMKGVKRLRESETFFPNFHSSVTCGLPAFEHFPNGSLEKIRRPFGVDFPFDPDPGSKNLAPIVGAKPGSHAHPNGNLSTSQPLPGAVKLELPSLQYPETDLCSLLMSPPTPPEVLDAYVASPPMAVSMEPNCVSPRNSGLLDALLHEAQAMSIAKNQSSEKSSNYSTAVPHDPTESLALNICNADWEAHSEPFSPADHPATSDYSACAPPTSGSSLDESSSGKTAAGVKEKSAAFEHVSSSTEDVEETEVSQRLGLSRSDALLGLSDWCSDSSKDNATLTDVIATLLGEDLGSDCKHVPIGTSSAFCQDLVGGINSSCPWNNMPRVPNV